jgi:hypothetical protein
LQFKNGEVSGLHNWIRFLYLEQNRQVPFDYKGFLIKREASGWAMIKNLI